LLGNGALNTRCSEYASGGFIWKDVLSGPSYAKEWKDTVHVISKLDAALKFERRLSCIISRGTNTIFSWWY
jgi:hypothetical protein